MSKKLKRQGRLNWVSEDTQKFLDPKTYEVDPMKCYKHLKRVNVLNPKQLGSAQYLAAWREKKSIDKNMPRRWVLADETIIEACKKSPKTIDQLFVLRGIKNHISTPDARKIVEAIKKGHDLPKEQLPSLSDKDIRWNDKNLPDLGLDSAIDVMCSIVRVRAKQNNIAPQTLSSNRDLSMIAHGMYEDIPTLQGWRYEIVGRELIDLLNGKISISIKDKEVVIKKV